MKYPVLGTSTSSVLPHENPPEQLDNMQLLLQKKVEVAKNKAKYTLTEGDGTLISAHAVELIFNNGQVIGESGQTITNIYRIKQGKVDIYKNNSVICQLTQGFFIGEGILLREKASAGLMFTLKANGPVTLLQLDLEHINRLFSLDIMLALKFYRLLSSKLASIFHQLIASRQASAWANTASTVDFVDTSSDTSSDIGISTSEFSLNTVNRSKRSSTNLHESFKVYPLLGSRHGIQTCRIKATKIKVVTKSFGFQHKTSIDFAKLNAINKIADNAITIIYATKKFKTVFFKNYHDLEEFLYLVGSLTATSATPIVSSQPITSPSHFAEDVEDAEEDEELRKSKPTELLKNIQVTLELKQGERVYEEGDLYQRVYTLVSGTLAVIKDGIVTNHLTDGQVFGVDSLLYLRPCAVTLEVASERATILVTPAYKIYELIDSDVGVALRLYKRAGQVLAAQIHRIIRHEREISERELLRSDSSSSLRSPQVVTTTTVITAVTKTQVVYADSN